MGPGLSVDNAPHGLTSDSIFAGQISQGRLTCRVALTDVSRDFRRKSCCLDMHSAGSAFWLALKHIASLCPAVTSIVLIGAEKQMIRSDAEFHVAPVTYKKALWNRARSQDVCYAVSGPLNLIHRGKSAIATTVTGSGPQPTIPVVFVHFCPEPIRQRDGARSPPSQGWDSMKALRAIPNILRKGSAATGTCPFLNTFT